MAVFYPLRPVIHFGAKHRIYDRYLGPIHFNEAETFGVVPTLSYNINFGPTVGVSLFHDDLGGHEEQGSARFNFGGVNRLSVEGRFQADRLGGSRIWTDLQGSYERHPNLVYAGLGSKQLGPVTRFSQTRYLGLVGAGITLGETGRSVQLGTVAIANDRDFGPAIRDKDISIEDEYDTSTIEDFDTGVFTVELNGVIRADFTHGGIRSRGVYIEGGAGPILTNTGDTLIHGGIDIRASTPLYRGNRMILARVYTEGVFGDNIPFTALPRLGGPDRLRGYRTDRLRDQGVAGGSLGYSWPVHKNAQAEAFFDVGAAAADIDGLVDSDAWRWGTGLSLALGGEDDTIFRVDVAYGDGIFVGFTGTPRRTFLSQGTAL